MTDKECILYYSPGSYYSHIALLTLYEKEVNFSKVLLDTLNFEQNEPWYIRINPKGLVPALKHGDQIITESKVILDFLDSQYSSGIKLVPSLESKVGNDVSKWRDIIQDFCIERLSFGIAQHPELSETRLKVPYLAKMLGLKMSKHDMAKKAQESTSKMKRIAEKYPDIKEALLTKAETKIHPAVVDISKEWLQETAFKEIETILDMAEKQINSTRTDHGVLDVWLVSPRFTAADISLAVFLNRLHFLGLLNRFISEQKRPLVFDYYNRLLKRKSFQTLQSQMKDMAKVLMKTKAKTMAPYLCAAVCAYAAYKTHPIWMKYFR